MTPNTRTPLQAPSRPETVSADGIAPPWPVRAHIPFPEPRNHGEEIRNMLAERDAETQLYDCPANDPQTPALTPEQSARMVQYVERLNDDDFDDFDAALARWCGRVFLALAAAGGFLIGWSI